MPSFPRRRESRPLFLGMFKGWYGFKTLDSRLCGNDGMGIAILICFGKQVSDGLLPYLLGFRFRQFLRRFLNHVRREFVQAVGVS